MTTGTIKFEKINGGNPYVTAFYAEDTAAINADEQVTNIGANATYSKMYSTDTEPAGTKKIRSYEVYVDLTPTTDAGEDTATNEVVTRLARIAPSNTTDYTDYDVTVLESDTIVGSVLGSSTISLTNKTGGSAQFRVVFVCDVE